MTFVLIVLFISYTTLVTMLYVGWIKASNAQKEVKPTSDQVISVIVPARNEEKNIGSLLEDLSLQKYPLEKFEVIIVDDHSEDETLRTIESKKSELSFANLKIIPSIGSGKKYAITTGVEHAKGEIVVTTDADCRVSPTWLQAIQASFIAEKVQMVFGPVRIDPGNTLFSKMQAMEFASLIGSGAASMAFGIPTMCNGANLAYRKKSFDEVSGYEGNTQIASGDDEFLMKKINTKHPEGIRFNNSSDSIVTTKPQHTLSQFISQRIRWAGKWRYSTGMGSKMLALYVFVFHLTVLSLPVLYFTGYVDGYWVVVFLLLKLVLEFIFVKRVTSWLKLMWHWPSFLLLQISYSWYAVVTGFAAHFIQPVWKGRK